MIAPAAEPEPGRTEPLVVAWSWPDGPALPEALARPVVAIGNFDGVHLGHRVVLRAAADLAARLGRPLAALTFEPHPRSFFRPSEPVFRLTPLPLKAELLAEAGASGTVAVAFDAALAGLSDEAFVDGMLIGALEVAGVVVGHDFHFGRGRVGDAAGLAARLAARGLPCEVVAPVMREGEVVASRAIRAALEAGDIAAANAALGWRWRVRAVVRHGNKRGRELGFPTANLHLPADCRLRHGIYAVEVALPDGGRRGGVASFGRRPTFDGGEPKLEVMLFDFAGDLYGRELDVAFVGWIRGEERFDGVPALVARMEIDVAEARALLAR